MIKVFFDSECVLCRRYQQAIKLIADDKIEWVDIHRHESVFPVGLSKQQLLSDIHIQKDDGELLKGADALGHIITLLPGAARFSWLMEKDSSKKAIDLFHSTSEKLRRRLLKSCPSCKNKGTSP